jgi:Leucine-rich repeat (LRR) protein
LSVLAASSQGIQGLSGLEQATNLISLSLPNNSISDLSPLRSLPQLQQLILNQNLISDLSPLASCTNLNYLELRGNLITNSAPLAACTRLSTLYLGANAINDLSFAAPLAQLQFVGLDHNQISDLSLLTTLTNLSGLDLGYNPVTNVATLGGLSNLSRLYLSGNSLSTLDALTNLNALTSLTLYSNQISDISVLYSLSPHLSDLGLSWNPLTNFSSLSAFTNLSSLWLDGDRIPDLSWISGLGALQALGLQHNGLGDLSGLKSLTNLVAVHADYNRLNDVGVLSVLPQISWVGLVGNLLNTNAGSIASAQIQTLQTRGANVSYIPQAQKPSINALGRWFIAAGETSTTKVYVSDALTPDVGLAVWISSSNPVLVPESNVSIISQAGNRILSVTPAANQLGTTILSLGVTNEAGLSSSTVIEVAIVSAAVAQVPDPGLEAALRLAIGKPGGALTSVDLLGVNYLFLYQSGITNLTGLELATNLESLDLDNNFVRDLSPILGLPQLSWLSLSGTRIADLSPLTSLSNLTYLDLGNNGLTGDLGILAKLTNLVNLGLDGNYLTDCQFLTNLPQLSSLDLTENFIRDASPIASLTNLSQLFLRNNRISNLGFMENLPRLIDVDVTLNLADLSQSSAAMGVIRDLLGRGVAIVYLPQYVPPLVQIDSDWHLSANADSYLSFHISENGQPPSGIVRVSAISSNTNLVSNDHLVAANEESVHWVLRVTPVAGGVGTTIITISATNDAGLGSVATAHLDITMPLALDDGFFGTTNLAWFSGGQEPWFGQTNVTLSGLPAAQSGRIGSGGDSWLQAILQGPGILKFWWKVSSETNYDWLQFESDAITNMISGEVNWQFQQVGILAGGRAMTWRFTKDPECCAVGLDAGWVAGIDFAPGNWLEISSAPTDGQLGLILHGALGHSCELQASTNSVDWSALSTIAITSPSMPYIDTNAFHTVRFYRLLDLLQ